MDPERDTQWREEIRTLLTQQGHWTWFFAGSGSAIAMVGVILAVAFWLIPVGNLGGDSAPPGVHLGTTTLVSNPSIVQRGGASTISLIIGGGDGELPCSPVTAVWESDIGQVQVQALLADGTIGWVDMEGGPTDAFVVRWVAPQERLGTGHVTATLTDCAQAVWIAEAVIPVVVGSPPQ